MATVQWNMTAYASTDATFRAQLTQLRDNLVACGLVQVMDTGTIDLTTVVRSAANAYATGFLLFRFNDSLQATAPVFLKVNIYNLPTTVGCWCVVIQLGTGTDGAGTLANPCNQNINDYTWCHDSVTYTRSHFMTGDGSRIAMFSPSTYPSSSSGSGSYFVIERTKTNTGQDSAEGVIVFNFWYSGYATHASGQSVPAYTAVIHNFVYLFTATTPLNTNYGMSIPTAQGFSGYVGNNKTYTYPFRPYNLREFAPPLGIMACVDSDFPGSSVMNIATYDGLSHPYFKTSYQSQNQGASYTISSNCNDAAFASGRYITPMFRWE